MTNLLFTNGYGAGWDAYTGTYAVYAPNGGWTGYYFEGMDWHIETSKYELFEVVKYSVPSQSCGNYEDEFLKRTRIIGFYEDLDDLAKAVENEEAIKSVMNS